MGKQNILVVEDDEDIQQLVSYNLVKGGFYVSCADSGEEALDILKKEKIDLVLLDLMLPGISGLEVCKLIKDHERTKSLPVIILTAKGEEEDIITGLEAGADDYITKPFSAKVLLARIRANFRRINEMAAVKETEQSLPDVISLHGIEINSGHHSVMVNGKQTELTATEFAILHMLATRPGWVFTRQQIIDSVRGYDYLITPRSIDVQIFGLRKKLGETGNVIETVRGIGYRFKAAL